MGRNDYKKMVHVTWEKDGPYVCRLENETPESKGRG